MKKLLKFLPKIVFGLSLLTFFPMFLPAFIDSDKEVILSGLQAAFGGELVSFKLGNITIGNAVAHFSVLNLIAFVLPALISLFILGLGANPKKWDTTISILKIALFVSFVVSLVLMMVMAKNTNITYSILGIESTVNLENATLAVGPILGIVFSGLGVLLSGSEIAIPFISK